MQQKAQKKTQDAPASQFFNYTPDSYLERTSRPFYALVFLLPFIAIYELGTFFVNTDLLNQLQIRVVAFVWLQNALSSIGIDLGSRFAWMAPSFAAIIILIAYQIASGKKWKFYLIDYCPMMVECILMAVPLLVLSLMINATAAKNDKNLSFVSPAQHIIAAAAKTPNVVLDKKPLRKNNTLPAPVKQESRIDKTVFADIITGIGAGIYEELVFRLFLIIALMIFLQNMLKVPHTNAIIFSVIVSAALFSIHHHFIFLNGHFGQTAPFNWTEFSFRAIAGVYFAVLFAFRGFGITAGTHAFYDIMAVLINSFFFE